MKNFKKMIAVLLMISMVMAMNTVVFADTPANTVFCNFICAGQITGKTIPAGSNVVAPSVPVVGGFTFCGFDKSLKNITSNTTFTAVYVSDSLGKAAIEAKKKSLPTPAITATTVANPNAPAVAALPQASATTPGVATGVVTQATATPAEQAALLQLQQLILAQQAQQTQAQKAAVAAAATTAANVAAAPATQAAAAAVTNAAVAAAPVVAAGIPSWVVGLEGVDAAGAAKAYQYLKNTKGLDDATIQANWGAFMHHYAGHGVAGW